MATSGDALKRQATIVLNILELLFGIINKSLQKSHRETFADLTLSLSAAANGGWGAVVEGEAILKNKKQIAVQVFYNERNSGRRGCVVLFEVNSKTIGVVLSEWHLDMPKDEDWHCFHGDNIAGLSRKTTLDALAVSLREAIEVLPPQIGENQIDENIGAHSDFITFLITELFCEINRHLLKKGLTTLKCSRSALEQIHQAKLGGEVQGRLYLTDGSCLEMNISYRLPDLDGECIGFIILQHSGRELGIVEMAFHREDPISQQCFNFRLSSNREISAAKFSLFLWEALAKKDDGSLGEDSPPTPLVT